MAVTKKELKQSRLTRKTNLRQGRRTYRLKGQEAKTNLTACRPNKKSPKADGDLKQVKTATKFKSPTHKVKRSGKIVGRETLYLTSQDD